MANDLVRMVEDIESSLATQPAQYATQLELLSKRDEKILAEFLRQERDERPHYSIHKDWEKLVGSPKKYSRPVKYMEEIKQKFPELDKQIREIISDGTLLEMGVSFDIVDKLGDLLTMNYRIMGMQTKLYECVVAYAKQISDERLIKPIDVVRSFEGRDEIYRRTFKTRDQFEWYNTTSVHIASIISGVCYNMMESFKPTIRIAEDIPIGGGVKRKLNKALKEMPPKAVTESFLRDEMDYNVRITERIYGEGSGNSQAVDI